MFLKKQLPSFLIPHIPLISFLLKEKKLVFGFIKNEKFDFCFSGSSTDINDRYIHAKTKKISKIIDEILLKITFDLKEKLSDNKWEYGSKYILNIPHSGNLIPQKYINDYCISNHELEKEKLFYCDKYIDKLFNKLFAYTGGVYNKYSRLFMDPERFYEDEKEELFQYGLGWFYENCPLFENKKLRTNRNKKIISKYYKNYHKQLEKIVTEKLELFKTCSIIDCHSFSDKNMWFQKKQLEKFPDICIGFDEYHKDEKFIEMFVKEFKNYTISFNYPYQGSIIPLKYFKTNSNVKSTMIEINKNLYLNKNNTINQQKYDILSKKLNNLFYHIHFK